MIHDKTGIFLIDLAKIHGFECGDHDISAENPPGCV